MEDTGRQPQVNFVVKAALLSAGVLLALGMAEVLTRIFVPDPKFLFENQIGLLEKDAFVGFKNKPNFHGHAQGFIRVETNSLGYRGKEVTREKPQETFRILGLGDSVMWGVGVQDEVTYLRLMERKLNESAAENAGFRFEIVNTAVVGYSTHQELRILQHDGIALCPALVLVGFEPNDTYPTEDPFYNVNEFHQPPKRDVQRREYLPKGQPGSYFYSFLRSRVRFLRELWEAKRAGPEPERWNWPAGSFEAAHWPEVQEHLRAMNRLSKEQGFGLLVLVFPTRFQADYPSGLHPVERQVAEFLKAENIGYIVFHDVLRGRAQELFFDQMHLKPEGHQVVADTILRYLKDHRVLPEESSNSIRCGAGPSNPER